MIDIATLQAALVGYQAELSRIDAKMAEIRKALGPGRRKAIVTGGAAVSGSPKRTLSAAARKRIAAAQKKRWAAYHQKQKAQ